MTINIPLADREIPIVKSALLAYSEKRRESAAERDLRLADDADEIVERMLYAKRVGCRRAA